MRLLALLVALAGAAPVLAQPTAADSAAVAFIKAEATERGEVMRTALWLTDINGPRLTASPQLDAAQAWAVRQFEAWGLTARLEPWGDFGRGWEVERFSMNAHVAGPDVAPHSFPVAAFPKAWSPGVGPVTAEVVYVDRNDDAAVEAALNALEGKIVLLSEEADVDLGFEPIASRRDAQGLLDLANAAPRQGGNGGRRYSPEVIERYRAQQRRLNAILGAGPAAVLEPSSIGGHGSIRVMGAAVPSGGDGNPMARPQPWAVGAETVPQVVVMTEQYNRLVRLLQAGQDLTATLDLDVAWHTPKPEENVIAEIPGTDPLVGEEVVMLGAHLDSWHGGTGATDNASGSAVVMEAARVLSAYYREHGEGPRRTIRFALWTGEEQGLHGSLGYVNAHLATVPGYGQTATALKPDHERFSAYYNLDNGTGRIRGVYLQENDAVGPVFRSWLGLLADSTAQTLSIQNTGGTDHLAFDQAGLPGFQFIQDPVAYFAQTWHGSMDTYDHLVEEDLEQAATVMALFAHLTAERDALLPRKPFQLAESAPAPAGTGLDELDLHGHGH